MHIESVIDTQRAVVLTIARGELNCNEMIDHEQWLRQAAGFRPEMNHLADFREASTQQLGWKEIRSLAFGTAFAPSARRAVVVATDEGYGVARMFQMAADRDDENMQVFRDIAQARRWLGLDDPEQTAPGGGGHPPGMLRLI